MKLGECSLAALLSSGVQVGPGEELGICCRDGTQDVYPHHPEDLDMDWSAGGYLRTIISDNFCY